MTTTTTENSICNENPRIISDALYGKLGERVIVTAKSGAKLGPCMLWAFVGDPAVAGGWTYTYVDIPAIGTVMGTYGNIHCVKRVKVVAVGARRKVTQDTGVIDEDHSYDGFRKTGEEVICVQDVTLEIVEE